MFDKGFFRAEGGDWSNLHCLTKGFSQLREVITVVLSKVCAQLGPSFPLQSYCCTAMQRCWHIPPPSAQCNMIANAFTWLSRNPYGWMPRDRVTLLTDICCLLFLFRKFFFFLGGGGVFFLSFCFSSTIHSFFFFSLACWPFHTLC